MRAERLPACFRRRVGYRELRGERRLLRARNGPERADVAVGWHIENQLNSARNAEWYESCALLYVRWAVGAMLVSFL